MRRIHSLALKLWPVLCGLVVGSLLGGITRSWSVGALFGSIAWIYFSCDMSGSTSKILRQLPPDELAGFSSDLSAVDASDVGIVGPWDLPDPTNATQQAALHCYGAAGVGIYAHLYDDD